MTNINNDFSFNPIHKTEPKSGYMVSFEGLEVINGNLFDFIKNNLNYLNNELIYIGRWTNESKVYFDISINVQSLETALFLGKLNKQIAIFNLNNMEEIIL